MISDRVRSLCQAVAVVALFAINLPAQQSGYSIEYNDAWPANDVMKYVRVSITPIAGVATQDIDFHVVAKTSEYRRSTVVSTVVSLRKGDTTATGELYLPFAGNRQYSIHTELDGDHKYNRGDFAYRDYHDYRQYNPNDRGITPTFVFASSSVISDEKVTFSVLRPNARTSLPAFKSLGKAKDFPSFSDAAPWYGQMSTNFGGGRSYSNVTGTPSPYISAISLKALPSKWFGYEGLEMLMMTHNDLKLLEQAFPSKLLAIQRWVASSGRLVVLNCGEDLERTIEVLKILGDSASDAEAKQGCLYLDEIPDSEELDAARETAAFENGNLGLPNLGFNNVPIQTTASYGQVSPPRVKVGRGTLDDILESNKAKGMVAVQFEMGQVICVSDEASDWKQEKEANVDRWGTFALFLGKSDQTSGVGMRVLNSGFLRDFGFPQFVEPPRYVFESSILAYLILVGPVAFFLLKRKNKLNLMFIVVPVISLVFCSGILAFAVFNEGFETRVNLFTTSRLNQRNGRLNTLSMAHIYSGMTPAAYRLEGPEYGMVNFPSGGRVQRMEWDAESEEISGGEIRARTNHQLFTRSSTESQQKLVFGGRGKGDSESIPIQNQFDVPVVCVVFRTEDCSTNQVWYCDRIEPGATGVAEQIKLREATRKVRSVVDRSVSKTVFATGRSYTQRSGNVYRNGSSEDVEASEVAVVLRSMLSLTESELGNMLTPPWGNSYMALTEGSINYSDPIREANYQSQIHVVHGYR